MTDSHRAASLTSLEEVLAAELGICTELLQAANASRQALHDQDPDALQACIRARESKLGALAELERRATTLRAAGLTLPPQRHGERTRLRALTDQVSTLESELHELSNTSLGGLRKQLRSLNAGRKLLHGYRGAPITEPRFPDRRG